MILFFHHIMSVYKHLTSAFLTLTAENTQSRVTQQNHFVHYCFFVFWGRKSPILESDWMFILTLCTHRLKDERSLFTQSNFPNLPLRKMEISLGNK